jgi:hypothetical protein
MVIEINPGFSCSENPVGMAYLVETVSMDRHKMPSLRDSGELDRGSGFYKDSIPTGFGRNRYIATVGCCHRDTNRHLTKGCILIQPPNLGRGRKETAGRDATWWWCQDAPMRLASAAAGSGGLRARKSSGVAEHLRLLRLSQPRSVFWARSVGFGLRQHSSNRYSLRWQRHGSSKRKGHADNGSRKSKETQV